MDIRTGFGYDIHQMTEGKGLLLGGVLVPAPFRIVAHSDGDIVYHALAQALLSALGLEDIGTYFPDSDAANAGLDSSQIVRFALAKMTERGYHLQNVVIAIVLQSPKLFSHKMTIRNAIASLLNLDEDRIAVHAGTAEKLGPLGKSDGIEVFCQLLIAKN